jgi:hypothetical protein
MKKHRIRTTQISWRELLRLYALKVEPVTFNKNELDKNENKIKNIKRKPRKSNKKSRVNI